MMWNNGTGMGWGMWLVMGSGALAFWGASLSRARSENSSVVAAGGTGVGTSSVAGSDDVAGLSGMQALRSREGRIPVKATNVGPEKGGFTLYGGVPADAEPFSRRSGVVFVALSRTGFRRGTVRRRASSTRHTGRRRRDEV